ncbi:MalM family protein [Vibrio profundi]|uniref:MalM family protein n=1 Tax=Vibrio profundi TaxID=1774960 RepID=UPI0037356999
MKKQQLIFGVLFSALLGGCSTTSAPKVSVAPPQDAAVCCSTYAQLPFITLAENEKINFKIDASSPVARFEEGNSYFSAFEFNGRSLAVEVALSSLFVNDSVFTPQVLLLDKDYAVVDTVNYQEFKITPSDAFSRTQFQKHLEINTSVTPYMVVYTPAPVLGKPIVTEHPAKIRAKEFGEVMPMVTDPVYIQQVGGSLELSVTTNTLKAGNVVGHKQDSPKLVITSPQKVDIAPQPETQAYFLTAIEEAVSANDIPKALSLLEEAKALNIEGAQDTFVKALEAR